MKQEASPSRPFPPNLDWRCKETEKRVEQSRAGGRGRKPAACLQSTFFFWKPFSEPFLFIVDQPGRENEKVRRERESGGSHGDVAARSGSEHRRTPSSTFPPAAPSRAPSPGPPGPGPRPADADSVSRARSRCTARSSAPRDPTRARPRDLLRVPRKGIMPFGHVIVSTGSETSKK